MGGGGARRSVSPTRRQPGAPGSLRLLLARRLWAGRVRGWFLRKAQAGGTPTTTGSSSGGNSGVTLTCDGIGTTKFTGRGGCKRDERLAWRILSREKAACAWCRPGGAFCTMASDGDWLSLNDQDVRGIGADGDGEFARVRLAFADAHFKCISVQVSTAGGIALNAPWH